jgi:hypothetical protein
MLNYRLKKSDRFWVASADVKASEMVRNKFKSLRPKKVMMALYPVGALMAIISLFLPWVSGKLLVVGKTITGLGFPNVFLSVLIGCIAIIAVYIWGIMSKAIESKRPVLIILSLATFIVTGYFLYSYSRQPGIPGVSISLHGGVLLTLAGLTLSLIGAIIPWKSAEKRTKHGESLPKSDDIRPDR